MIRDLFNASSLQSTATYSEEVQISSSMDNDEGLNAQLKLDDYDWINHSHVFRRCQKSCLRIYSHKDESGSQQNPLITRAVKRGLWSTKKSNLLYHLDTWRRATSWNEEILPASLCSLELLISIAITCPQTENDIRKINNLLPELLSSETGYIQEVLQIVKRHCALEDGSHFFQKSHSVHLVFSAFVFISVIINKFT